MSIINLLWEMAVLLICSIIQVFGVFVEGIAKILKRVAELLESAHDRVLDQKNPKKKQKKVHINVPL